MNERYRLASELDRVLAGAVDLGDVLEKAPSFGEPMNQCFHGLQHYLSDADIRAKDPEYRSMQESEMRRLIGLLRSETPISDLRLITFLGAPKRK